MRQIQNFSLFVLIALTLVGCATTQTHPNDPLRSERVDLDPMLVRAGGDGNGEAIDVNELFERAYTSFAARRYEDAAENYRLIVKHFPESRFYLPAAFNAGLSYEKLSRWRDAEQMYGVIIDAKPSEEDTKDAYYRRAEALSHLEEWEGIEEMMTQVLLRNDLNTFDRVEAHVRRASALGELDRIEEAADGYRTAIDLNENAPVEERLERGSNFIVQSYFGLGEIHHRKVSAIKLVLPTERMTEDLQTKADEFLRAQHHYIRALSFHHPQWSMAAGYMIGKLYQDFYEDIFAAEIPDDLSDEAIALYFDELRKQIRPLMVRAVQVYEKNLSLSKRIGQSATENAWVADTTVQLERMKAYLDDPETQRRAERFALRGQRIEEMWAPVPVARDTVDMAVEEANGSAKP